MAATARERVKKSRQVDWTSEEGLQQLKSTVGGRLPFTPNDFQLRDTAELLMGRDVLCVSATGDGKSAIFYMYSMVREDAITIVVSPTNALESDMVKNMHALGLRAVAINSETTAAARLESPARNLWDEAKAARYQLIFVSPETLSTNDFRALIRSEGVRARLRLLCVDECHLVDEWGADFRKAYANIGRVRPWLPESTVILGLTATLEPGRQTETVTRLLGFTEGAYHFDKRDCERHNIDIILRAMQHTYTTSEFRDLDWLIPADMKIVSDVLKTLLYCESIELGHRVATYLRSLLPPGLQKDRYHIIRHMHSMMCPQCKQEGLASLYQSGEERETAIYVATDVLGTGLNMHDFDRIVCFPTPSSIAAAIQRIGRAARGRDRHGVGYIFIKKADIKAVVAYLQQDYLLDLRLLRANVPIAESFLHVEPEEDGAECPKEPENGGLVEVACDTHGYTASISHTRRRPDSAKALDKRPSLCPSLRLVIAAHVQGLCISRQINIIYGNPGISENCGRCSSCQRSSSAAVDPTPTDPSKSSTSNVVPVSDEDKVPRYMKMTAADVADVAKKLRLSAVSIRLALPPQPDFMLVGSQAFLPQLYIDRITTNFHLITSIDVLRERMKGWLYWDIGGTKLWKEVERIGNEMRDKLDTRHQASLTKQRERREAKRRQQVRDVLADAGLLNVTKVKLLLPLSPRSKSRQAKENYEATPSPTNTAHTTPVSSPVRARLRSTNDPPNSPTRRRGPDQHTAQSSPSSPATSGRHGSTKRHRMENVSRMPDAKIPKLRLTLKIPKRA